MGLREVLKHHARGAGRWAGTTAARQAADNAAWLEECAARLLCVLALDRFGDYVADQARCPALETHRGPIRTLKPTAARSVPCDAARRTGGAPLSAARPQVVAPVRETCAQAVGAVARELPAPARAAALGDLVRALGRMQARPEWEVRHGATLGSGARPSPAPRPPPREARAAVHRPGERTDVFGRRLKYTLLVRRDDLGAGGLLGECFRVLQARARPPRRGRGRPAPHRTAPHRPAPHRTAPHRPARALRAHPQPPRACPA